MRIYTILPIRKVETGHYVIDDPTKPAHKEILSSTPIYIIEEKLGGFFLNSYTEDGIWVGDTWHPNVEEAKEQAEFIYKARITKWEDIPEEIEKPIEYVLKQFNKLSSYN